MTADKRHEPGIDLEDCHVSQCNGLPAEQMRATSEVAVWKAVARCKLFGYLPDHRTSQTKGNPESHRAPQTRVQPGRSSRAMSYNADRQAAAHHQRTRKLLADCLALGSALKTVMLHKPGRGPESSCREQRSGSEGCARCELGTGAEGSCCSQARERLEGRNEPRANGTGWWDVHLEPRSRPAVCHTLRVREWPGRPSMIAVLFWATTRRKPGSRPQGCRAPRGRQRPRGPQRATSQGDPVTTGGMPK